MAVGRLADQREAGRRVGLRLGLYREYQGRGLLRGWVAGGWRVAEQQVAALASIETGVSMCGG